MSMPKDKERSNTWIDNDILRVNICLHVAEHPNLTAHDIAKVFDMDLQPIQHQIRRLIIAEYLERHGPRHKATYVRTKKEYETKYSKEDLETGVAHSTASALQKLIADNHLVFEDKDKRTVIKVNAHTTIYLNSKKPVAKQTKEGRRSASPVSIGSGMAMFGSW